jgi:IclR family KDG regulon transcriptional repressor
VPEYSIGVVEDAIRVLEALLAKSPQSLSQLTRTTGLSKNKAFRMIHTLEKHRLVDRPNANGYALGTRFVEFGHKAQRDLDLLRASASVMDHLARETEESIFLGIADGDEALCVDMRESPHSVRLFAEVGRRAPLYAGGVPKVLLAFAPERRRRELLESLEIEQLTPYTITDKTKLAKLLDKVRRQGYLVISDDLDVGAHSVAAPIRRRNGAVVAAISVAGPSSRFTPERVDRYVSLVCRGAADIGERLNHGSYGSGARNTGEPEEGVH